MKDLQRRISLTAGLAIAVPMVVGSGIFGLPGLAIESTDHITAFYAWIVVVCVVAPFIQIFSQLGMRFPDSSGIAGFAAKGLGAWSRPGFTLVACGALAIGMPALFLVGGEYIATVFSVDPAHFRMWFAILIAVVTTLLNVSGIKNATFVNKAVVGIIVLFVMVLVSVKMPSLMHESAQLTRDLVRQPPNLAGVSLAASIIFWAFQGWENLSFGLAEFSNPSRTIPRVYWSSFIVVSVGYLTFAWIVSAAHYDGVTVSGLSGLSVFLGSGRVRFVLLMILILILITNANSWVFGASRAFFSAAKSSLLPDFLSKVNRHEVPANCLIVSCVFYCAALVGIESTQVVSVRTAFLLTTVSFIVLYGFSVVTYVVTNHISFLSVSCALLAAAGLAFLIPTFSWLLLYPVLLFGTGTIAAALVQGPQKQTAHSWPPQAGGND